MVLQTRPDPQVQSHERVFRVAALKAADRALYYPASHQMYLGKDAEGRFTTRLVDVADGSPTFVLFEHIFGGVHLHSSVDEAFDNYWKVQQALQLTWKMNGWGDYLFQTKRDLTKLAMHLRELADKPHILSNTLRDIF